MRLLISTLGCFLRSMNVKPKRLLEELSVQSFLGRPSYFAGVFSKIIVLNNSLSMFFQFLVFEFGDHLQKTFGLVYQNLEGLANRLQIFFEAHRYLKFTR